jgi:hypothetical protein
MKVSDLILELQEFYQQYGDLEIVAPVPQWDVNGKLVADPQPVLSVERIGKPLRAYVRTA